MTRKKLRYEWDHLKREFTGPSLAEETAGLKEAICLINNHITVNSGITWKPPIVFIIFMVLTCVCGYTASYLSITNQKYSLGMIFLIVTPILVFCFIVVRSLRPNRYTRISNFMKVKSIDYQSISRKEGFHFDFLVIDSRLASADKQKQMPVKSKKRKCQMLVRVDVIDFYLEYTEAKRSSVGPEKVAVKIEKPKPGVSIKRVRYDDLLHKKETNQTTEGMKDKEKVNYLKNFQRLEIDLSARQPLTVESRLSDHFPPLHPKVSTNITDNILITRKPVFKETDEEISNPHTQTEINDQKASSIEDYDQKLSVHNQDSPNYHSPANG